MNTALKINNPDQQIKEIQSLDRNILKDSVLITNVSELILSMNYLESQKNVANVDVTKINQQLATLHSILEQRIRLTATVLGITESTHIFIPETISNVDKDLIGQSIEERMMKSENEDLSDRSVQEPAKKESKTIDATKQFVKKAQKDDADKAKAIVLVKGQWFKGYERKEIYGTPEELSKEIQTLLTDLKTESNIDAIANLLIHEKKYDVALNLSLDLFAKVFPTKTQEEIEKRFLFDIVPYSFGQTCEPKETMENITLWMWCDQFFRKSLETVHEDDKAKAIVTPNLTAVEVKQSTESKELEQISKEDNVDDTTIIAVTMDTLSQECLVKLQAGEQMTAVLTYFRDQLKFVPNITEKEIKEFGKPWSKIVKTFKDTKDNTPKEEVITPENKEEIVAKAEEAAVNGKDTIESTKGDKKATSEFLTKGKEIIAEALKSGKSAMNEFRTFWSKDKKAIGDEKVNDVYNKLKEEIVTTEEPKMFRPVSKTVDLSTYPDVLESANLVKNITELADLVRDIIFNKKDKIQSNYLVAYSVVKHRINALEGHEEWNAPMIDTWFKDVIKAETIRRKEEKESHIEDAIVVEEIKNSTDKPAKSVKNDKSFDTSEIAKDSNSKRVKVEVSKALLAGIPEAEIIELLKENPLWKNSKDKNKEVLNVLNKVKRNTPELNPK